jgi:Glutaminase
VLAPNATVSTAFRLDPPLERERPVADALRAEGGLWVEFEDGRRLLLDPEDSRSTVFVEVLVRQRRQKLPVYVEFDPETTAVTGLRIPLLSAVLGIRVVDRGVLDVVLAASHARHYLREVAEDFETLRERLDQAQQTGERVIVVEDDAHDVIDVQPAPPGFEEPGPAFPRRPPRLWPPPWRWLGDVRAIVQRAWCWRWWPCWWCRCVSAARAQQAFDDMQATSCAPLTVPPPCIPFLYPDDGCWGRAHEMCRLMQLERLHPRKVWIQGSLHVATRNNPQCYVDWSWHVAPTLCVRGPGFFEHKDMVIDPSLFTTPVTEEQWKAVQGDPLATLTDTDASVFKLFYPPEATDPTYALTNQVLDTYRSELQLRSANQGPPPYANCP